jgi:hypothetical protein
MHSERRYLTVPAEWSPQFPSAFPNPRLSEAVPIAILLLQSM